MYCTSPHPISPSLTSIRLQATAQAIAKAVAQASSGNADAVAAADADTLSEGIASALATLHANLSLSTNTGQLDQSQCRWGLPHLQPVHSVSHMHAT